LDIETVNEIPDELGFPVCASVAELVTSTERKSWTTIK